MTDRYYFRFFGFVIFLVGLLLISKNINFTGFVVGSGFDVTFYFVPFVMFVGGILMMLSGDSLQAWLEKKEAVSSSDSLEGKLQTKEEEKFFKSRYSGEVPWYKRIGRNNIIQEKQDDNKYSEGVVEKSEYAKDFQNKSLAKKDYRILSELRKEVLDSKKDLDIRSSSGDFKNYYEAANRYNKSTVALSTALKNFQLGMSEDVRKKYFEILQKKSDKVIDGGIRELEKDIVENKFAFGSSIFSNFYTPTYELNEKRSFLEKIGNFSKLNKKIPSMEQLEQLYLKKTKTIPISKFTDKYTFLHSFPLGEIRNSNTVGASYDSESNVGNFLDCIIGNSPMLSVFSIDPKKVSNSLMSRLVGVMLENGKIYDASNEDLVSKINPKSGLRYRNEGQGPDSYLPIDERVKLALSVSNRDIRYNEFIVGDYKIKGLYFSSENIKKEAKLGKLNEKKLISEVVNEAKTRELPLYEISKSGIKKVSSNKYLKSRK